MPGVADAEFEWFTFLRPQQRSRSTWNGHVIDHAMVKWDSLGRDRPGAIATTTDLLVKGPQLLERVLRESLDAELLVLATWNDLARAPVSTATTTTTSAGAGSSPTISCG
jgi:hypothetical protein